MRSSQTGHISRIDLIWYSVVWGAAFWRKKEAVGKQGRRTSPCWNQTNLNSNLACYILPTQPWSKVVIPVQVGTTAVFYCIRKNIKQMGSCESWVLACTSNSLPSFLVLVWSITSNWKEPISTLYPVRVPEKILPVEEGPSSSGHTVLLLDFSYVDLLAKDYSKSIKRKTTSLSTWRFTWLESIFSKLVQLYFQ